MKTLIVAVIAFSLLLTLSPYTQNTESQIKRRQPTPLTAGMAMANWFHQRSFPGKTISMDKISDGFLQLQNEGLRTSSFTGSWDAIGPKNFGGRTLSLAFNPQNPNTIYAGSASGGLWRSFSAGIGAEAWHPVPTGFPLLGVSSIVVNPADTNEIFLGTGEVYNDQNTGTGFAIRTTRGTYGIGILKSSDGGFTWIKSLDWAYDDLKGVQDIIMNPVNPSTLFAATTEGTFRTFNSGQTWTLVNNVRMATDLLIMPGDTSIIMIAAGNSFSANPGIYRSVNGGTLFSKITNGLPSTYSGKGMLDVCTSSPNVIYASLAEQLNGLGLFRSNNSGLTWFQVNSTDFQLYQGWFAHDVLVKPSNPDVVLTCGVDMWKSVDGGVTLDQKSYWYNWDFSATTVGGSEGPGDYVHADIHRMYHHPQNENIVYLATDGGIFRSLDGGENYQGCNGGYQTQQFYANFSNSHSDSLFAIGGMQDNATGVYEGNPGWRRVIGGDGLSTAIHSLNDQIVFGSSQYLNIRRSDDKAVSFSSIPLSGGSNPTTNFAGPFVMCEWFPDVMYAGKNKIYKSQNNGLNWGQTNNNNVLDSNAVLVLEVADYNPDLVYAATAPVIVPQVGLFRTLNGGLSWVNVTAGIPNRYILDIAIDPDNENVVYVGLGGFGTPHLFRSVDNGNTWNPYGYGLPDVPVNSITIDPLNTSIIYLGNDIGVYVSIDAGLNWQPFNDGLFDGTLVMDISISHSNRKLRLATHGKGVYEREMLPVSITGIDTSGDDFVFSVSPNPATSFIQINSGTHQSDVSLFITDISGKIVINIPDGITNIDISNLNTGIYFVHLSFKGKKSIAKILKM